jgi:hypothetical protein
MIAIPPKNAPLDPRARIEILLAEYRELYALALYRMNSIEGRIPIAAGMIAAFLGGIIVLPDEAQLLALLGTPASLFLFVQTAMNHARSFEDILRRIEEIESRVNELAGETLLAFQSTHPSRARATGGRTGTHSIRAMFFVAQTILLACAILFFRLPFPRWIAGLYVALLLAIWCSLLGSLLRMRAYRYQQERQPPLWRTD